MWFVWILSAGARHFIEILPMSLLDDEVNFNIEHQLGKFKIIIIIVLYTISKYC